MNLKKTGSKGTERGKSVLLLGNYRATIECARQLKTLNYHVIVGTSDDLHGGAESSRACDEVWQHPTSDRAEALLSSLGKFLAERADISVVFPVAEDYVRFLSAHREELPSHPIYAVTDENSVRVLLDKSRAFSLAKDIGVPVAPFEEVVSLDALHDVAARVGWPVVVKPSSSGKRLGNEKIQMADTPEELARQFAKWPASQQSLLVQRKTVGTRYNVYFAAEHGRLVRLMQEKTLRTDRLDESGLAVEGVTVPLDQHLARYTQSFATALSYNGIGCAQYLVDGDGETNFLEINPRIDGNHAVGERAGLELTRLAVALAEGPVTDESFRQGKTGLRYIWTHGDLGGVLNLLRGGAVGRKEVPAALVRLIVSALRADMHLTWLWRDPRPTFEAYIGSFSRMFKRGAFASPVSKAEQTSETA